MSALKLKSPTSVNPARSDCDPAPLSFTLVGARNVFSAVGFVNENSGRFIRCDMFQEKRTYRVRSTVGPTVIEILKACDLYRDLPDSVIVAKILTSEARRLTQSGASQARLNQEGKE